MKQLNITILLTVLLSMVGVQAFAHDAEVDGIYYNLDSSLETATVTYKGSSSSEYSNEYTGSVVIPKSVTYNSKIYSVTSIGSSAFNKCSELTSVTIPNSVTSIGDYAFNNCSGLTSINIPNSVTTIGNSVFYGCTGLTSITIPNSVTSIGSWAFYGCSALTSITIPNSVTSIEGSAFDDTAWYNNQPDGLVYAGKVAYKYKGTMPDNTSITIEDGTLGISDMAFYGCSGLASITIPNSVTSIGTCAFFGCSELTSITIPNSLTSIGYTIFSSCSGLTSIVVASGNTKYDSRDNCNAIIETASNTLIVGCMNTIIPNSVTSLGESAFFGCSELTSVNIPNSVTSIGTQAFLDCSKLTSFTIPNSVTNIGDYAFYNCSGLNSVYNEATTPQYLSFNPHFNYTTATLHVPAGTKELYKAANYWKNFSNIVEDINTVIVEDDKEPATTVEGEEFYNLVLDKETVEFAEKISANEAGKGRIAIKDGGLLIVKGDDVRFALSEIKKGDILVFDFVGKIRCLYGTLTANTEQQNTFPQVTSDEMELESGKEYVANDDCDVVLEMETTDSHVELKSITITEPTGVSIVETSTNQSSSGKTYNLFGQQVNANSNGLLIRDGKKVIK